ncbi:hypothetical protein [Propionispora vibrioides]|jgi:hypothetical protein|uniref:Uncharacterized protein n=1 Tax=Propionispora vibrioides TaxID=112903 RepID=A0A1H8SG35_9FIRM|nr:hypothetical protein [Propionispora vibrioides]SEO77314.1 hypothetical protein SAMN04490178_10531 [Propionispora vibrioides]
MRLRRRHRRNQLRESKATVLPDENITINSEPAEVSVDSRESEPVKSIAPEQVTVETPYQPGPGNFLRRIINNPNFSFQAVIILLTLFSDNFPMERHLNGITTTVDKIRNVTEVVNSTMQSLKVASEAPRHIRKMLE